MTLERIRTVEELHNYLHTAIQLEHATIPPYMMALYSIHPQTNPDAVRVLRVVIVEEMLHLTLAANLLNAVGGKPDLTLPGFVPQYPAHLPDGETDFEVDLDGFSKKAVETFMKIERPAQSPSAEEALVERTPSPRAVLPTMRADDKDLHFYSIGEFYQEIARGMAYLHNEYLEKGKTLFVGDRSLQVTPEYYYSGGGQVIPVVDLQSAQQAIRLICEQGEGLGSSIYDYEGELSHYYRFQELLLGRYYEVGDEAGEPTGQSFSVDWEAAYPIRANARWDDYEPGSELLEAAEQFDDAYNQFLALLTRAFAGEPQLLIQGVGDMFRLKELMLQLVRNPLSDETNAAPVFGATRWRK